MYRVQDWAEVHRLFEREGWSKTKIAGSLGDSLLCETPGQGTAPISLDTAWCHTTSDYGAGVRKAALVIKNRFHSGDHQQPAEDLPPCRGADSQRHRIRSHFLKGTCGQQVVEPIGFCCCEPGTGIATIPKADRCARAWIVATDLGNGRRHAVSPDRAAFRVALTTLIVVPQFRGSICGSANHELVSWLLGAHRRQHGQGDDSLLGHQ